MKRYDSYKDSGVEWIGNIPSHWKCSKYKYYFESGMGETILREDLTENGEIPVFSATESDKIFGYVDEAKLILQKNDLVIPARGNSIGHLMLVEAKATCTQTTIYFKNKSLIDSKFAFYFAKGNKDMLFQFDNTAIPQITVNQVKNNVVLIPSSEEQTIIANYLDHKTTQIDHLIAKKEQFIQLLEEERVAVINQAVTKGLDTTVPMKDSGIDWLGEIPEHWEVKPMKYIVKDLKSGVSVNSEDIPVTNDLQLGILKTSCVYNYSFRAYQNKQVVQQEYDRVRCPVKKNSIIISRMNTPELVGASGFVEEDFPNLFLPDRLWITEFYDNIEINVKWLSQILISDLYKKTLSSKATGTSPSMKNISKDDFLTLPVPYAPFIEQCEIAKYLSTEAEKVDEIISKFQKEIELLNEYKTALISEVVTGKVDIRNEKFN